MQCNVYLLAGEVNRIYTDIEKYISLVVIRGDSAHKNKAFPVSLTMSLALQRKEKIHIL